MLLIILLSSWNGVGGYRLYRVFKKKQVLFDDHFTLAACMAVTMLTSFLAGLYLILLFPDFYIIPLLSGLWIGWRFGAVLRSPALLSGLYNGAAGALTGTMLGAVLQNPALCRLPAEAAGMADLYSIPVAAACFYMCILASLRYSLRM
ncbi:hypothetical protein [Domibacillus indicus]|uniref:hypothetical protein n=1 Tax=Domibacillus indicus TaxID=1437523 RepID=UPI000617ACFC|nr:hypothetical protein [Domibacillus indicus]